MRGLKSGVVCSPYLEKKKNTHSLIPTVSTTLPKTNLSLSISFLQFIFFLARFREWIDKLSYIVTK